MFDSAVHRRNKKLEEAALVWAAGDQQPDIELKGDAAFFGGTEETFNTAPKAFWVHPDNHKAVIAFCNVATQWVLNSKDKRYGLNYAGCHLCWDSLNIELTASDFQKVQDMEKMTRQAF